MKTTSVNRWFYVLWKLESMCTVFIAPNLPFSKVGYTHTLLLGQRWWVIRDSLMAQMVKSLPAMRETWVQSLGQKDPLEVKMATRSSILAWKIPWTEEPGGPQSVGSQRVGHDWACTHAKCCEKGTWPLWYSCPRSMTSLNLCENINET